MTAQVLGETPAKSLLTEVGRVGMAVGPGPVHHATNLLWVEWDLLGLGRTKLVSPPSQLAA